MSCDEPNPFSPISLDFDRDGFLRDHFEEILDGFNLSRLLRSDREKLRRLDPPLLVGAEDAGALRYSYDGSGPCATCSDTPTRVDIVQVVRTVFAWELKNISLSRAQFHQEIYDQSAERVQSDLWRRVTWGYHDRRTDSYTRSLAQLVV